MPNLIKLDLDTPMTNPLSGAPVRSVSAEFAVKHGMKSNSEMAQRVNEFPICTLDTEIINILDSVVMTTNELLLVYGGIVTDIRKARQQEKNIIEIPKETLEKFKSIFTNKPPVNPINNKTFIFIVQTIELAMANSITEANTEEPETNN